LMAEKTAVSYGATAGIVGVTRVWLVLMDGRAQSASAASEIDADRVNTIT
jgi:hypothetical protein